MKEPTELQKKQEARLQELINTARQRYLAVGGDPLRCPSGRKGDDYMTDEERQEAILLMRHIAGVRMIGNDIQCQGRVWQIPTDTSNSK